MPVGTHLGPWLLGTAKDTTGTTATLTRNTGATVVAQTSLVTTANDTIGNQIVATGIWIPAGARLSTAILDLPSLFDYSTCSGSGALSLYLRNAAKDSGAKNSIYSPILDAYELYTFPVSNNIPAYTRLVYNAIQGLGLANNLPNANNVSQGVNTDRQVWLLAYSTGILPSTIQVTVQYMVRNTNTTYQPSSTTGP